MHLLAEFNIGDFNVSNKYKHGDRVPDSILASRLDALSDAVTKGKGAINREFTMRVPAELDHDADLVLSQAAERLREFGQAFMTDKQSAEFADTEYDVGN